MAMEATRINGEMALLYLGQALYRHLDLGFYTIQVSHLQPSRLPPLIPLIVLRDGLEWIN
jgi:hypothetical protein